MLEAAADLYGEAYNEAIRRRVGSPSAMALNIEAPDLDALYARLQAAGVEIVDPLADRPWGQSEFTVADPDGNWLDLLAGGGRWRLTRSGWASSARA